MSSQANVVNIEYHGAFDPAVYEFPNGITGTRVAQTIDAMKTMLNQPNKKSRKMATTSIVDSTTNTLYNIQYFSA
jgi:hypothetical protein